MADFKSRLPIYIGDKTGAIDLAPAQDGVAEVGVGIEIYGSDGTNDVVMLVDSAGKVKLGHDTNTTALFSQITDGTNELTISVEGSAIPANGVAMHAKDSSGNSIPLNVDADGALIVSTDVATGTVQTSHASANLVKDTPTTVASYSPSSGTDRFVRVTVSGSGRYKAELKWGTTTSETVKDVKFGSSSNPNVMFDLEKDLELSDTETILVSMTNLENASSPTSDFDGYATIYYVD